MLKRKLQLCMGICLLPCLFQTVNAAFGEHTLHEFAAPEPQPSSSGKPSLCCIDETFDQMQQEMPRPLCRVICDYLRPSPILGCRPPLFPSLATVWTAPKTINASIWAVTKHNSGKVNPRLYCAYNVELPALQKTEYIAGQPVAPLLAAWNSYTARLPLPWPGATPLSPLVAVYKQEGDSQFLYALLQQSQDDNVLRGSLQVSSAGDASPTWPFVVLGPGVTSRDVVNLLLLKSSQKQPGAPRAWYFSWTDPALKEPGRAFVKRLEQYSKRLAPLHEDCCVTLSLTDPVQD